MISTKVSLLLILGCISLIHCIPWSDSPYFPEASPYAEWMPNSGFVLTSRWQYPGNTCFQAHLTSDNTHNYTYYSWDAQNDCSICKGAENAAGFHHDPNDCSSFFHCAKYSGTWYPNHKTCPKCQFWDQDQLACIVVYSDPKCYDATTKAPTTVSTEPPPPTSAVVPKNMETCVTFDNGWDKVQGLNWIWVWASGVQSVFSSNCLNSGRCGYFNGNSRLEIPRYSNSFRYQPSFSLSLFYNRIGGSSNKQGILSNGCFTAAKTFDEASTVFVSSTNKVGSDSFVNAGLRGDGGKITIENIPISDDGWHHVVISWDGNNSKIYVDGILFKSKTFQGPIINSYCPIVIGDFINSDGNNNFHGYIDEICIFRKALTVDEVAMIHNDPNYAYGL